VKEGEILAVLESVKAVSDVYSPVSGEVIGVNETWQINPN
jgi:glycine cleavage system H protein